MPSGAITIPAPELPVIPAPPVTVLPTNRTSFPSNSTPSITLFSLKA